MGYIYDDEDNAPMIDNALDRDGHNPTVYMDRAEMKATEEPVPFSEEGHDNGCWNCWSYNGDSCMKDWNNADPDYYMPDRDDHPPDYICDDWRHDPDVIWEEVFGE